MKSCRILINKGSLILLIICVVILSLHVDDVFAENMNAETDSNTGTFNDREVKGFDPDTSITCIDSDGNGWMSSDECSWDGSTSTPWFANPSADTQNGTGVSPGGSGATLGQTATTTIEDGPHFTIKYYNEPSAPNTTYEYGVTSTPSGSLREQHNEFGFEVVIDKKTDPLEPYYLKFYIPYTTVDSTQLDSTGEMSGDATGIYSKEVTEMDPNNPGVFNMYTITGTFTSTGSSYTVSSSCDTGCTSDEEWQWRSQWP